MSRSIKKFGPGAETAARRVDQQTRHHSQPVNRLGKRIRGHAHHRQAGTRMKGNLSDDAELILSNPSADRIVPE